MAGSDVHFEVLPNGLTLLLRPAQLAPVVNLQIWAQVGSADEGPGEQGLAHPAPSMVRGVVQLTPESVEKLAA